MEGHSTPECQSHLLLWSFAIAPCKGIQDTLGFWIPRNRSRIPVLDCGFFVCGIWISDSNRWWDTGFLELYYGFQRPEFWPPQQTFDGFLNPDSRTSMTPVILFAVFFLSFPFVLSMKTRLVRVSYIHSRAFHFPSNFPILAFSLCYCHFPFQSQSANGCRSGLLFSDLRSYCKI